MPSPAPLGSTVALEEELVPLHPLARKTLMMASGFIEPAANHGLSRVHGDVERISLSAIGTWPSPLSLSVRFARLH